MEGAGAWVVVGDGAGGCVVVTGVATVLTVLTVLGVLGVVVVGPDRPSVDSSSWPHVWDGWDWARDGAVGGGPTAGRVVVDTAPAGVVVVGTSGGGISVSVGMPEADCCSARVRWSCRSVAVSPTMAAWSCCSSADAAATAAAGVFGTAESAPATPVAKPPTAMVVAMMVINVRGMPLEPSLQLDYSECCNYLYQ